MKLPPNLIEAYQSNSFAIFIGAGISRASGLPSWEELLVEFIQYSKDNYQLDSDKENELLKLSKDPSNYLLVAEELKDIMKGDLQKQIKKKFSDKKLQPSSVLKKIIKLKANFIITTNYDELIEKAFVELGVMPNYLTYKDPATINYNIMAGDFFILKAHGDARSAPSEIVLTEHDYRNILFKEKGYQSVLHVLFSTCHILFLGASLKDPELKLMLSYIHNIFHGGSPNHFAFMNQEELSKVEVGRWRSDYNIHITPYDPSDNHKELELLIDQLLAL